MPCWLPSRRYCGESPRFNSDSPLIQEEKVLGNLILRISGARTFTPEELQLTAWVAQLAPAAIRNAHHYESLLQEKNDLERLAMIDFLTDTYNHRYFSARLEEEFNRAIRYSLSLSCILLDIDDFKWVNDTYGHRRGDTILREVASVIKGTIRKTDFLARYGERSLSSSFLRPIWPALIKRESESVRQFGATLTARRIKRKDYPQSRCCSLPRPDDRDSR